MKKFTLTVCLVALLAISAPSFAQTIGTISVGDINYAAAKNSFRTDASLLESITSSLNTALIESRKFNVLTYAELQKRLSDQGRSLQGYYTSAYANESYKQAGLDYIVSVDINGFDVLKQQNGKFNTAVASVDLAYKLYGVGDVTEDSKGRVSAKASARINANNRADSDVQNVIDAAVKKAVDQLAYEMISGIFPIRIMRISEEGAITLNYGQGLLSPGDTVKMYPEGVDIELNEAGQPLGETIGTLQIISTQRKFSVAKSLDGQELLKKGQQGVRLRTGS